MKKEINANRIPIYRDSGFVLQNADDTVAAFKEEGMQKQEPERYIYSRYRNPTVIAAEKEIARQEGSQWALLAQSGMAAIDIALSVFQAGELSRPWMFFTEIYGGTNYYIDSVLIGRRGIDVRRFEPTRGGYDLDAFEARVAECKPEFVYFEAVSNPMLIVADTERIMGICKQHDARIIVDNTFATPWLWKPLTDGADLVVHSATKYFSGHGNLTAGVLCGNDEEILEQALDYRKLVGHMMSPDDAYRLHTQVQTFPLRFEQQCKNALKVAELLDSHADIAKVWYPGLPSHESHAEAKKLFKDKGYGAMITFDMKGDGPEEKRMRRDRFMEAVQPEILLIPTLGDAHTILMPVDAVWSDKYPEPGMIRMSIGFEDTNTLLKYIKKGL